MWKQNTSLLVLVRNNKRMMSRTKRASLPFFFIHSLLRSWNKRTQIITQHYIAKFYDGQPTKKYVNYFLPIFTRKRNTFKTKWSTLLHIEVNFSPNRGPGGQSAPPNRG